MGMKYIRFRDAGFILFEQHITHKDMSENFPTDEVKSAGFVNTTCEDDQIAAYGESVTLKTQSKTEDSSYLYRRLSIYC